MKVIRSRWEAGGGGGNCCADWNHVKVKDVSPTL